MVKCLDFNKQIGAKINMKNEVEIVLKNQKGFSLIEILIALTLLGLVGTFVGGKFFDMQYEGQVSAARIQMDQFAARLKEYRRKCYSYPTTDQGLDALVSKPSGGRECKDYPPSGFIEGEVPLDPWQNDYLYESDGREFNIVSLGQDALEGGDEKDVDIYFKKPAGGDDQE